MRRRLEHGYPTPSLERDGAIAQALPWLRDAGKDWWPASEHPMLLIHTCTL